MDLSNAILAAILILVTAVLAISAWKSIGFRAFLPSISSISQILFLIVAIFGYVFTVKPAYENKLLKEEVSENKDIIVQLEEERDDITEEIKLAEKKRENIISSFESLEKRATEQKNKLANAEATLAEVNDKFWSIYLANVRAASIHYFFRYNEKRREESRKATSIREAEKFVLTPYQAINSVVANNDYTPAKYPVGNEFHDLIPENIKLDVLEVVKRQLDRDKAKLSKHDVTPQTVNETYQNMGPTYSDGSSIKPSDDSPVNNVLFVERDRITGFFKSLAEQR